MRIVHNLVRDWKKISGQILYTHFEKGEEVGKGVEHKIGSMKIKSADEPQLTRDFLFVWGKSYNMNNKTISYTYSSEEEAIKMMEFINKFTIASDLPADGSVRVRIENQEEAESFLRIVEAKGFKWSNGRKALDGVPDDAKAIQYGNNFYYSSGDDWEKYKNISFNEFINGAESKQLKPLPEKWYINVDELPEEYREQFFKFIEMDNDNRFRQYLDKQYKKYGINEGVTRCFDIEGDGEQISIEDILIHMGINKPRQEEQTLIATKPKSRTKAVIEEELKKEREEVKGLKEEIKNKENDNKLLVSRQEIIVNDLLKEKQKLEEENKKLSAIISKPKKTKKATGRSSAWDDIIIDDATYNKLKFSFKTKMPLLLRGPSGTGKSSIVRALGEDQHISVVEFNFNSETTVEHLLGHKILVGGNMLWEDGLLTDAVRNGKIFIGHEINASSPGIQFILNGLLELNKGELGKLSVQGNNGEVLVPHKNFRFYGTYNPGYLGTKMFGTSIMSRFIGVDVNPLGLNDERMLLLKKFPNEVVAINLLTEMERRLRENKNFSYDISTRDVEQCLRFIDGGFSIEEAILTCVMSALQIELDKDQLREEIKNITDYFSGFKKVEEGILNIVGTATGAAIPF